MKYDYIVVLVLFGVLSFGVSADVITMPTTDEGCKNDFGDRFSFDPETFACVAPIEVIPCDELENLQEDSTIASSCKEPNFVQRILENGVGGALSVAIVALFTALATLLNPRVRRYLSKLFKKETTD